MEISFNRKVHIIIGKPGSGKTHLTNYLLKEIDRKNIIMFSPTFFDQKQEIQDSFKGASLIQRNFDIYNYNKIRDKIVIFDDIGKHLRNNKSFEDLIINRRHRNCTIFILIQFIGFISPVLRSDFSYIYIFNFNNLNLLKNIYENFTNRYFENVKKFDEKLKELPEYGFIICDFEKYFKAKIK